jgi:MFS family permease
MGLFALCAVLGTSVAPVGMAWVEMNPKLEWRWIQWIQIIIVGAYLPAIPLLMPETRSTLILRKTAKRLRKERFNGLPEKGAKYTARSEVGKPKISELMKVSLIRPLCECSTWAIAIGRLLFLADLL